MLLLLGCCMRQYFRGHLDVHAKKGRMTSTRVATLLMYHYSLLCAGDIHLCVAAPKSIASVFTAEGGIPIR